MTGTLPAGMSWRRLQPGRAMSETAEEIPDSFTVAGMSWVILREAVQSMSALIASGVIAYALVSAANWKFQQEVAELTKGIAAGGLRATAYLLASLPLFFLHSIVLAAIAIPIHRLVLRDEKANEPVKLFAPRTFAFAGWLVATQFAYVAIMLPLALLSDAYPVLKALFMTIEIAAVVALFVVVTRLSLLFPAIALGLPVGGAADRLRQAWALSRGFFWRIVVSTFFAVIPLGVVMVLVGLVALIVLMAFNTEHSVSLLPWWQAIATTVSQPVGAVLGAAALSWNYRFATFLRIRGS